MRPDFVIVAFLLQCLLPVMMEEVGMTSCGLTIFSTTNLYISRQSHSQSFISKVMRRVQYQAGVTISFLESIQRELDEVYAKVKDKPNHYDYDWLPKHSRKWYKEQVQCLNRTERVSILLPYLYSALQNYSLTLMSMRNHTQSTEDNDLNQRLLVWHNAFTCEVEAANHHLDLKTPQWKSEGNIFPLSWWAVMTAEEWLSREWGVYMQYTEFLQDWYYTITHSNNGMRRKAVVPCREYKLKKESTLH